MDNGTDDRRGPPELKARQSNQDMPENESALAGRIAQDYMAQDHIALLLGGGHKTRQERQAAASLSVPPGGDAAQNYVREHFDKKNPVSLQVPGEALKVASKAGSNPGPQALDTTIFVNLAANRGLLNSSLREDEEIRQLEKLTKDRPVKIVVQTAMSEYPELNHLRATKEDMIINALGALSPDKEHTEVVRYEIANGSKKLLYSGHSRGLTEDLSDLLKADPTAMTAKQIVLLNRAHGTAMHGLRGDAGYTSVSELKTTLNDALTRAGRKSFDLLDLDSCLMGNAQTLTELAPTAKYIIAAEEPEVAVARVEPPPGAKDEKTGSNAQPLAESIRKLIANPQPDAHSTARAVFATNAEECSRVSKDGLCGANTLGLYDSAAAPEFAAALDKLGKALMDAAPLADNKDAYQAAIGKAPQIDGEFDGIKHDVKRRDLGSFVRLIQDGLADNKIIDTKDGALAQAVNDLRGAMNRLVLENFNSYKPALKARFEEVKLPPAALDGVSVFLHERQPQDMQETFKMHMKDDSLPSQPHWNEFVAAMGL